MGAEGMSKEVKCGSRMVWGVVTALSGIIGLVLVIVPLAMGGCSCAGDCVWDLNESCWNFMDGCTKGGYDASACTAHYTASWTAASTGCDAYAYYSASQARCTGCGKYWDTSVFSSGICTTSHSTACLQYSQSACTSEVKPAGSCTWDSSASYGSQCK